MMYTLVGFGIRFLKILYFPFSCKMFGSFSSSSLPNRGCDPVEFQHSHVKLAPISLYLIPSKEWAIPWVGWQAVATRAGGCGGRFRWNRGSYKTEDAFVLSDPIGRFPRNASGFWKFGVFWVGFVRQMVGLVWKDEAEHLGKWRRFRRSGEV